MAINKRQCELPAESVHNCVVHRVLAVLPCPRGSHWVGKRHDVFSLNLWLIQVHGDACLYSRVFLTESRTCTGNLFIRRFPRRSIMYSHNKILLTSGPIIISKLLEDPNISFAWALRISAFISLPLVIVANCFIKKRLPPREPGPFVDVSFFQDPRYCLFVAAQFLVLWGNWTPYFFVQSIAAQVGVPSNIAFYLVAIINGLSLPGRIIPGIIADKVGPWNVFVPSAISAGILTFACIGIHSAAGLYTYCVLYGLFSGIINLNLRRI